MTRYLRSALSLFESGTASERLCQFLLVYTRSLWSLWRPNRPETTGFRVSTRAFRAQTVQPTTGGERGQALVEEALLLGLIGIVAMGALAAMGVSLADVFGDVAGHLSPLDPQSAPRGR